MEFLQTPDDVDSQARPLVMLAMGVKPGCRRCGAELSPRVQQSFLAGKRVKCQLCDWYGNWRDNTPLARSTLNNLQFLALFYKYSLPDNPQEIANALGISPTTVREWRIRIINLLADGAQNGAL